MGARQRAAATQRLVPAEIGPPLLIVATGHFVGEGFDCPALDTLFLAGPVSFKGRLVQYAGRILRAYPGKETAEVHDYHDVKMPVLAAALAKRAPGYLGLGFPTHEGPDDLWCRARAVPLRDPLARLPQSPGPPPGQVGVYLGTMKRNRPKLAFWSFR